MYDGGGRTFKSSSSGAEEEGRKDRRPGVGGVHLSCPLVGRGGGGPNRVLMVGVVPVGVADEVEAEIGGAHLHLDGVD
eukprot:759699-Hanusia_phi.AAC.3